MTARPPTLFGAIVFAFVCTSVAFAAACTNPVVRREWRSLTLDKRAEWIRAVKCLGSLPHDKTLKPTINPVAIGPINPNSSNYDDFVYVHMDLNTVIHFTGLFLPWHRWYLHSYEEALKSKCGYAGISPYWDWTLDAASPEDSPIFDPDPVHGLGTAWGDLQNDLQLTDGAFGLSSGFQLAYPIPHALRRNFTIAGAVIAPPGESPIPCLPPLPALVNETFTPEKIATFVSGSVGDFASFQAEIEPNAHSVVHGTFRGDLSGACPAAAPKCAGGPGFAANDPVFWLHHAMVDKVWYDWQHKRPENARAFEGGSVAKLCDPDYPNGAPPMLGLDSIMPGDGLFPDIAIDDVIDTTGGVLCYVYA